MPRYLKNYDKKTKDLIKSIRLLPFQEEEVKRCLERMPKFGNVMLRDVFEDMYKLYVYGTSTEEIAKIYSRSTRTIQSIFKDLGIERQNHSEEVLKARLLQLIDDNLEMDHEGLAEEVLELCKEYIEAHKK